MVIRTILYGYSGAILAGLIVSVFGYALAMPIEQVVAISSNLGIAGGLIGLGFAVLRRRTPAPAQNGASRRSNGAPKS